MEKEKFENCFISVTCGQPNILLNNHQMKVLYDAMDSVFFEDVEWTWDFGDDHLKDGVYKCKITITHQDEFGIYFHIGDLALIVDFDLKQAQNCKHYVLNRCILRGCKCEPRV